jgi:ferredoxin
MARRLAGILLIATTLLTAAAAPALAEEQRFPAPEFRSGYQMPRTVTSDAPAALWDLIDVTALVLALSLAAYFALKARSRRAMFFLVIASLLYFGFYRKGCVCAIGSIQNVALAAGGNGYVLPWQVAAFFIIPLLFALFFGRVFCAGVCPLGAIQDVVLWRPVQVPNWVEVSLGLFAWVYLGLGILYAVLGSDFVICRYDPFVGFFRMSGPWHMLFIGMVLLGVSMFVGRVYCRFICPYGVLLKLVSPFSKRRVTITPSECVDCRLCEKACPFGAIRHPRPAAAPRHAARARRQLVTAIILVPIISAVFALAGWLGGPALAGSDFTVKLARRIQLEESGQALDRTDESEAFRGTGRTVQSLYADAGKVQGGFTVGSTVLGGGIGLVVGVTLARGVIRRQRAGYTADAGSCLACARCYESCPVELEHRQANGPRRELVTI